MSGHEALWSWGDVAATAVEGAICLSHRTDRARLWVRGGRLVPGSDYAGGTRAARRELARVGAILRLRERGRYLIHAAGVVDPDGRAWLLSGDSGSGKSTLAYALARAGWKVLGDDGVIVEVDSAGATAYAWRDPLRVSTSLVAAFPELESRTAGADPRDPRSRVPIAFSLVRRAPLGGIVFVRRAEQYRLARADPLTALAALVRQSPWVIVADEQSRAHLDALARLAAFPCFSLDHTAAELHTVATLLTGAA